jgi:hypothetical protein
MSTVLKGGRSTPVTIAGLCTLIGNEGGTRCTNHPKMGTTTPATRMGYRRPPWAAAPPSLRSHNHLVPHPRVIALAGFLVSGWWHLRQRAGPDGRAGDRDRHQPRRPPQDPCAPSEPSEEELMPVVERGVREAWTQGQPVRPAQAPRLRKTSAGAPSGGRGPPRRPTRSCPAGAASPAVGQPHSGGSRP